MGAAKRRKEAGDPTYNLPKKNNHRRRRRTVKTDEFDIMPMLTSLLMMSRLRKLPRLRSDNNAR